MAPLNTVKRPAQHRQSSRKGKKAWRKNIDLTDIEQSIERQKDQEVTHGTSDIGTLTDNALFEVDDTGDSALKNKLIKRKQINKKLKSKEILDAIKTNSKVGAVKHHKHDGAKEKVQTVSKKELRKLMALAGKVDGESKVKNLMARDGLVKSASFDVWGSDNKDTKVATLAGIKLDVKSKDEVPEGLLKNSTTGWSIASVKPETLNIPPLKVRDMEELPHAGKSYNPNPSDWSTLIDKEYKLEKIKDDNRVALQEYREKIQKLMDVLDDSEEELTSDEDEGDAEKEDENDDDNIGLSVNEPVRNKKKTKHQRNRARRHEETVQLHQELKKLKAQVHDLEKLEQTQEEVQLKHEAKQNVKEKKERVNKKHKLGTKYSAREENLEVKFSDELSDSLRKLRPEGNLLYDHLRKLQSSGKIESRVPVKKSRRYKQKITQKWTHKDFK